MKLQDFNTFTIHTWHWNHKGVDCPFTDGKVIVNSVENREAMMDYVIEDGINVWWKLIKDYKDSGEPKLICWFTNHNKFDQR